MSPKFKTRARALRNQEKIHNAAAVTNAPSSYSPFVPNPLDKTTEMPIWRANVMAIDPAAKYMNFTSDGLILSSSVRQVMRAAEKMAAASRATPAQKNKNDKMTDNISSTMMEMASPRARSFSSSFAWWRWAPDSMRFKFRRIEMRSREDMDRET